MYRMLAVGFETHLSNQIRLSIADARPDAEVVDGRTLDDAAQLLSRGQRFDMVICQVDSVDLGSLSAIQRIRRNHPATAVLALFDVDGLADHASSAIKACMAAIPSALAARPARAPAPMYAHHDRRDEPAHAPGLRLAGTRAASLSSERVHLTPRQRDVLGLMRDGFSNKEIARKLDLSECTVKVHCLALFRELGVTNRTQAAMKAAQLIDERTAVSFV